MPNAKNDGNMGVYTRIYSDDFLIEMFAKYATFYGNRYALVWAKRATWKSVFFWLTQMNFYGKLLVLRGIITGSEFRRMKFTTVQRLAVA